MAVTTSTASNPLITTIVTDTDSDITVETAAGAAQYLYFVEITNPNSSAVYTKIFNAASSSTTTTQHYLQLYCPASTTCYMYTPTSLNITNGVQIYTSTLPGNVNSQISPTSDVTVKIGITAQ
jgi:hypothetical protein